MWPGCGLGSREEGKRGVQEAGAYLCCPDPYDGKTIPCPGLIHRETQIDDPPKIPGQGSPRLFSMATSVQVPW